MRDSHIEDREYMECLSPMYRRTYLGWKKRMLCMVDEFVSAAKELGLSAAVEKFSFTPRDLRLLQQLKYLTIEECVELGLVGDAS